MAAKKKSTNVKNPFTPEQEKVLSGIFHAVWQYIAYDTLSMVQEMDGKDWIPRDEVVELVLDADRPTDFTKTPEQKALYKQFCELPYELQETIAKKMFPHARYGM